MTPEERIAHNAEYLDISIEQVSRHDALMAMRMCDWPGGLRTWMERHRGEPVCGDAIASWVADWVRAGEPEATP